MQGMRAQFCPATSAAISCKLVNNERISEKGFDNMLNSFLLISCK